jgi:hypothetical protein
MQSQQGATLGHQHVVQAVPDRGMTEIKRLAVVLRTDDELPLFLQQLQRELRLVLFDGVSARSGQAPVGAQFALDVLIVVLAFESVLPAAGLARESQAADHLFAQAVELERRVESPGAIQDVVIRIAGLDPRPAVGAVAGAEFDLAGRRLHHAHPDRHGLRLSGIAAGGHHDAGESPPLQQSALEDQQLIFVIGFAGANRIEI